LIRQSNQCLMCLRQLIAQLRQRSTHDSAVHAITGCRTWTHNEQYITSLMATCMIHARCRSNQHWSDGIWPWRYERFLTKSQAHTDGQLQRPYFGMICYSGECIPHKMPLKFCFGISKIVRKYRFLEMIRTLCSNLSIMQCAFSSNVGSTPVTLKIGTVKQRPTRSGPTSRRLSKNVIRVIWTRQASP